MNDFKPCFNESNCTELQTDFIKMLNIFASTTRCDFYIEFFLKNYILDPKAKKNSNEVLSKEQQIYYNLRNDPQLRLLNENDSKQIMDEYEKKIKKHPYKPRESSNMIELNYLYSSCFYHENMKDSLCPYKNINWQFADARKYARKGQEYQYQIETFYMTYFSQFDEQFKEYFIGDEKNINKDSLVDFYNEIIEGHLGTANALEFFNDIVLILENLNGFITKLLEKPLFQKQLIKMNDRTKQIITEESFFRLGQYYKNLFFRELNLTDFIILFQLLIDFFTLCSKDKFKQFIITNYEEKKDEFDSIIDRLNQLQFTKEQFHKCLNYLQCMNNLPMDIYFILRSYKQDKGEPNKKVVLSYFGSIHSDAYVHYFTEIINTHRVIFASQNKSGELRRIEITPDINLNEIMRHTPIIKNFISGMKVKLYKRRDKLILCNGENCFFVTIQNGSLGGKKNKTKKIKRKTIKRW
jgi:hypothetical protein